MDPATKTVQTSSCIPSVTMSNTRPMRPSSLSSRPPVESSDIIIVGSRMFLNNYLSKVGSPILTIALFAVVKKSKGTWSNVSEYLWSIMQNLRVVTPIHITLTELSS